MGTPSAVQEVRRSEQYGAPRLDVEVTGHRGVLILPESRPRPTPWVWYAPTFVGRLPSDLHSWIFTRCLAAGVAVAGVDVGESYGSPAGRRAFTAFHDALVPAYGLAPKPVLLGQSRGGLMHYSWAVEHPDRVLRIAGIYPVCDLAVWPGVEQAAPAHELSPEQLEASLSEHNPVLRLAPLAAARLPILHLHGDHDSVIPLEAHSGALVRRYQELGGPAELVVVPGAEHEEIPAFFESPRIPAFVIEGR
jgi:pimeloyl-ACP methyl ester carboxylesterase